MTNKISVKVNANIFKKNFNKALDAQKFKSIAQIKMDKIFSKAYKRLLEDFNNHPVTKEIEEGPLASNISDTIGGGYGNLYSFIGFDINKENPIIPLRKLLERSLLVIPTIRRESNWYFKVMLPDEINIHNVTKMQWEDASWAEGIEEGISGINNYMFAHWDGGFSKEGFQLKYQNLSNIGFKPTPYLTAILMHFREKFE